jgi:hypothetical protein
VTVDVDAAFAAIDWVTLDMPAVAAFYAATGRPAHEQVLFFAPWVEIAPQSTLRRQCLADLAAMQKRACPGCAA